MSRHLPDANVLLALLWPRHEGHATAHHWFSRSGQRGWATNPLTQLGVLRLLTNPAITQSSVGAAAALEALTEATHHAGHEFWGFEHPICESLRPLAARLQGHQQWTDAVLLQQAAERKGVLVTFDGGIKRLSERELGGHVLLLKYD